MEANVETKNDDLKDFLIVLRRALLLIVRYVESKYGLPRSE